MFIVAPASANTLAKLAAGQADNLLCAAALACRRPLILAPAMNDAMYEHPATQANLATLRARGATVLEPGTGALGSPGEWGIGRLPEPPALLAAIEAALGAPAPGGDLDGLSVLVTAGGTREPIDAVRFIGNRSSGRMGFALADEAARRGAAVTVVAANVALPRNPAVRYVDVESAAELGAATAAEFERCDVLLMAAAVADYRPDGPARGQDQEDRGRRSSSCGSSAPRTSSPPSPPRRRDGPADRRLRGRDGRARARVRPRQARAQESRRRRRQRRREAGHRLRLHRQRGHDHHRRPGAARAAQATKAEVAAAILDAVLSHRSSTTLRV